MVDLVVCLRTWHDCTFHKLLNLPGLARYRLWQGVADRASEGVQHVNKMERGYWWWFLISMLAVAVMVLAGLFLGDRFERTFLIIFIGVSVLWVVIAATRRRIPESMCPSCRYPLQGLPGPICPECGKDVRTRRPVEFTRKRRWLEAGLLAFSVACVGSFESYRFPRAVQQDISNFMDWPLAFSKGRHTHRNRLLISRSGEPGFENARVLNAETLLIHFEYDTFPNHFKKPTVALLTAKMVATDSLSNDTKAPINEPAWTGEFLIQALPSSRGLWDVQSCGGMDVDSLVDAVLEDRLEQDENRFVSGLDVPFSNPDFRQALKSVLARVWASGLNTISTIDWDMKPSLGHLTGLDRDELTFDSHDADGVFFHQLSFAGSGSRIIGPGSYRASSPQLIRCVWVLTALGWLVTIVAVASVMRWYGRARQPRIPHRSDLLSTMCFPSR